LASAKIPAKVHLKQLLKSPSKRLETLATAIKNFVLKACGQNRLDDFQNLRQNKPFQIPFNMNPNAFVKHIAKTHHTNFAKKSFPCTRFNLWL